MISGRIIRLLFGIINVILEGIVELGRNQEEVVVLDSIDVGQKDVLLERFKRKNMRNKKEY